ncbi:MAG TPA: hypothetical protein VHZ76_03260, partial [Gammaproteobacteria bacterium]|nr:hypothetical protein [Gammaproteobacteria bacterium]
MTRITTPSLPIIPSSPLTIFFLCASIANITAAIKKTIKTTLMINTSGKGNGTVVGSVSKRSSPYIYIIVSIPGKNDENNPYVTYSALMIALPQATLLG